MLPRVLKNFNLIVKGQGYAGRVAEVTLPRLQVITEEFRLGGLDSPVQMDMGMEKLECDMTLSEYDVDMIRCFGFSNVRALSDRRMPLFFDSRGSEGAVDGLTPLILKGGLDDEFNGRVLPVVVTAEGHVVELDFGQWQPGQNALLKVRFALRTYRLDIDGQTLIDIDVQGCKREVDGFNQLASF